MGIVLEFSDIRPSRGTEKFSVAINICDASISLGIRVMCFANDSEWFPISQLRKGDVLAFSCATVETFNNQPSASVRSVNTAWIRIDQQNQRTTRGIYKWTDSEERRLRVLRSFVNPLPAEQSFPPKKLADITNGIIRKLICIISNIQINRRLRCITLTVTDATSLALRIEILESESPVIYNTVTNAESPLRINSKVVFEHITAQSQEGTITAKCIANSDITIIKNNSNRIRGSEKKDNHNNNNAVGLPREPQSAEYARMVVKYCTAPKIFKIRDIVACGRYQIRAHVLDFWPKDVRDVTFKHSDGQFVYMLRLKLLDASGAVMYPYIYGEDGKNFFRPPRGGSSREQHLVQAHPRYPVRFQAEKYIT
eukprot:TRINITY_DN3758_c0_g1_i1.p1 TRINITY_DN3758_c0_g1~~TRINITY_DN3758_c0_g1_i1.p1  ORF type:complete len:387 (-),score=38.43 TRINITY_DN3758_c0_g1_i1:266-1369(-)